MAVIPYESQRGGRLQRAARRQAAIAAIDADAEIVMRRELSTHRSALVTYMAVRNDFIQCMCLLGCVKQMIMKQFE